jgi:hypothetical protein
MKTKYKNLAKKILSLMEIENLQNHSIFNLFN